MKQKKSERLKVDDYVKKFRLIDGFELARIVSIERQILEYEKEGKNSDDSERNITELVIYMSAEMLRHRKAGYSFQVSDPMNIHEIRYMLVARLDRMVIGKRLVTTCKERSNHLTFIYSSS
jgi:hypothetical protein